MQERLQKLLSRAGVASRREAEALVRAGRVMVNSAPPALGMRVDVEHDRVTVDGKPLRAPAPRVLLLLSMPRGYATTRRDSRTAKVVYDLLPAKLRDSVQAIGSLGRDTEGLLLFTNDGALVERLTHPRYRTEEEYVILPEARPTAAQLDALRRGATVHGRRSIKPTLVRMHAGRIHVTVRDGAKHDLRSLCAHASIAADRIIRFRMGTYVLPDDLPTGQWRILT